MFNRLRNSISGNAPARATKATRAVDRAPATAAERWARETARDARNAVFTSDALQREAQKSIGFSGQVMDWISREGAGNEQYSEAQLENAYRVSPYLYATLRRIAYLLSTVRLVAEKRTGATWSRAEETDPLNLMLDKAGSNLLYEWALFYGMFGATAIYKRRTKKAVMASANGAPIYTWKEGAVAGLEVIPNAEWQLDEVNGELRGIYLTYGAYNREAYGGENRMERERFIYVHDFDPSDPHRGTSMVSLAIHSAVTNGAIARWAAQYFMSGAMPMLLVNPEEEFNEKADFEKAKNRFEKAWRGIYSRFALRSMFVTKRYNVEQIGIDAEKVAAPDLNNEALKTIAATFNIAPDIIIPPEGGSDNARHKFLIKQAFTDAIIPLGRRLADALTRDLALDECGMRIVVDEASIDALNADRADTSATELNIYNAGVESFGEVRKALHLPPTKIDHMFFVGGKLVTPERLVRDANSVSSEVLQYAMQAWDGGVIVRSEIRGMLGLPTPPTIPDGFKYEVVPDPAASSGGYGGGAPSDPQLPPPTPPTTPQLPPTTPPSDALPDDGVNEAQPDDASRKRMLETMAELLSTGKITLPASAAENASDKIVVAHANEETVVVADVTANPVVIEPARGAIDIPVPAVSSELEPLPTPEPPAYVYLRIGADDQLMRLQEHVKTLIPDMVVSDPANLHITLAYAPACADNALTKAHALLPHWAWRFEVRCVQLTVFPQADGERVPVVLICEMDSNLSSWNNRTRTALAAYGVPVSELSVDWTPHITLGYAPAGTTQAPPFTFTASFIPNAVVLARDDYDERAVIELRARAVEIPNYNLNDLTPTPPLSDEVIEEIAEMAETIQIKWQKHLTIWRDTGSCPRILPARVRVFVDDALKEYKRDAVFAAALALNDEGAFDTDAVHEDNPILARLTPASAQTSAREELAAWERSAARNANKAAKRFATRLIPLAVEAQVREGLSASGNDPQAIRTIFATARAVIEADIPPPTNADALAAWAATLADDDDLRVLIEGLEDETSDGGDTNASN